MEIGVPRVARNEPATREEERLRKLAELEAETQRGPDFLRLANALSVLYPRESEERRLLDAILLEVSR